MLTSAVPVRLDRVVAWTAAVGVVVTGAFVVVDGLRFAYDGPEWDTAIGVASAFSGVLAAVLVTQRFRRSASLLDLLLAVGLGVLAMRALAFSVLPRLFPDIPPDVGSWAGLATGAAAVMVLAYAAMAPDRRPMAAMWGRAVWLVPALATATFALVVAALDVRPPSYAGRDVDATSSTAPVLDVDGVLLLTAMGAVACTVAAVGFVRRGRVQGDELLGWVALAMTLAALSRVNYALYPSTRGDWVFTGDVLTLASFAALLVGSLREIAGYQPRLLRAAVVEDRRRMARDLHDGMAQELAFIVALARTKEEEGSADDDVLALRRAAERALEESRAAILALGRPADAPLRSLLHDAVAEVSARSGAVLLMDVPADLRVPEPVAEAVLRIVREAVSNATRHGRARTISVRVRRERDLVVSVRDDGVGFDRLAAPEGMGVTNMRERAQALGGALLVDSGVGQGTVVRVTLP